jgi:hypothetical protein
MNKIKLICNYLISKSKLIKIKNVLKILGTGILMCLGTFLGLSISGILGAGFGLTLGYVCGKIIFV